MELLASQVFFILVDGDKSLWIDRQTGRYTSKIGSTSYTNYDMTCLGTVYGFMGKLHISNNAEPRLVFVKRRALVGCVNGHEIYKILSVAAIPLESEFEVMLEPCVKSHEHRRDNGQVVGASTAAGVPGSEAASSKLMAKVKTPESDSRYVGARKSEKLGKVERRILDEFHKMFTEADSFYYSTEYDITNSVQRNVLISEDPARSQLPLWQRVDQRFFWNHYMFRDLRGAKYTANADHWMVPVMQGFIQIESCEIEQIFDSITGHDRADETMHWPIQLCIISRRSRFRAGTRYLRRGIDENGKVANYVETEQMVVFQGHTISFVQTRGSIPVFWSQPGFRYRPPPQLDGNEDETYQAFRKHFEEEQSIYGPITIVNLAEKTGKEKVLGDAFMSNILRHDSPGLVYISFDFHKATRGMKFENVKTLMDSMKEDIKSFNYCWVDSYGTVLTQHGVCRVNCIDCLDRTNVVQSHLAKRVLCAQLRKLGLVSPEVGLPENVKLILQSMWANNGDTISKQYAGTNALKGDYTRTGERKLTGVMRDGLNSANRFYLNRFKDAYRLAIIELMLGIRQNITEAELASEKPYDEKENTLEQIKIVIEDVKNCVVPCGEVILGSWGLINGRFNDPDAMDIDTIFILTERRYYVTEYDCTMDAITDTQKVSLLSIESIELGFDPISQPSNFLRFFNYHSSSAHAAAVPHLRVHYRFSGEIHNHQFRSSNIRFSNNANDVVPIQHPDQMLDALKRIAEKIKTAVKAQGKRIQVLLTALPLKEAGRPGIPAIASSLVNKYFSSTHQDQVQNTPETDQTMKKYTPVGFDRFTQKCFRRLSSAAPNTIICPPKPSSSSSSASDAFETKTEPIVYEDKKDVPKLSGSPLQLLTSHPFVMDYPYSYDININATTPVESHSSSITIPVKDLVLPSCGIIVLPQRRPISSLLLSTASELMLDIDDCGRDKEILGASPVTPVSDSSQPLDTPNFNNSNIASLIHSNNSILQRHRHSLPANSLGLAAAYPYAVPGRSVTPEITITEEPTADMSALDGSLAGKNLLSSISVAKRISRSSEDVNVMTSNTSVISLVGSGIGHGGLGLRLRNLAPIIKNENRSTSDQDIFGSLVNMKGSHSESALRDNPFQQPGSQKKDLVLAPLGKLARGMQNLGANYLDPRKIRDTFKQPRGEPLKKEEDESPFLAEQKRNCKTRILEL